MRDQTRLINETHLSQTSHIRASQAVINMFCSKLWLCILLLCCVALSDAWLFRSRRSRKIRIKLETCNSKKSCVSCTSRRSWSGQPCRWCPRTNKCHAHGAVFTNKCSRTENVVDPKACSSIVTATYNRSLAYKMVFLSALAYEDNVATYIPRATEVIAASIYMYIAFRLHFTSAICKR